MRYYATASTERVRDAMRAGLLGQIITPAAGNRHEPDAEWIADNAIFSGRYPGDMPYLRWLGDHAIYRSRCRFAVAPDVVCDHEATLARSLPMLAKIRKVVGRVAFVAQNGATPGNLPWDQFDAVFLGGDTAWKIGDEAATICAAAKAFGKWVHMGRVNSLYRMRRALAMGCDSADGTYLAYGPDTNLPKLLGWLRHVNQPALFDWSAA